MPGSQKFSKLMSLLTSTNEYNVFSRLLQVELSGFGSLEVFSLLPALFIFQSPLPNISDCR